MTLDSVGLEFKKLHSSKYIVTIHHFPILSVQLSQSAPRCNRCTTRIPTQQSHSPSASSGQQQHQASQRRHRRGQIQQPTTAKERRKSLQRTRPIRTGSEADEIQVGILCSNPSKACMCQTKQNNGLPFDEFFAILHLFVA